MKILLLGETTDKLNDCFASYGDKVVVFNDKLSSESEILNGCDFILSYGYRYIIDSKVINQFPNKIVNLHISYLPWNRGADCNLWSFLDDTEKGVSIHHIDEGLDTGKLIVQRHVKPMSNDTLRTSYERLKNAIEGLLVEYWGDIRLSKLNGRLQSGVGSYHRVSDKNEVEHLLDHDWDTAVNNLKQKYQIFLESQKKSH